MPGAAVIRRADAASDPVAAAIDHPVPAGVVGIQLPPEHVPVELLERVVGLRLWLPSGDPRVHRVVAGTAGDPLGAVLCHGVRPSTGERLFRSPDARSGLAKRPRRSQWSPGAQADLG